jgi:hypothetical protein
MEGITYVNGFEIGEFGLSMIRESFPFSIIYLASKEVDVTK